MLSKEVNADIEMLTKAPMVIIEGANHGSFSGNVLTDSMMALDIPPELTTDEACKQIAENIRIFISYNTEISYAEMLSQQKSMEQWYKNTKMSLQVRKKIQSEFIWHSRNYPCVCVCMCVCVCVCARVSVCVCVFVRPFR